MDIDIVLLQFEEQVLQICDMDNAMLSEMPPSTKFAVRHVVTVRTSDAGCRKICAVSFDKDDTVYVHLPYFSETDGILFRSVGRLINGKASTEYTELPHTTSSNVKFSYHPDGRAHFSQDSKVKTVVVGSLPPLVVHKGVLFQLHAYGFDHYESITPKDIKASSKKIFVNCTPDPEARGVVITGYISKPGICAVESAGDPRLVARSPHSSFLIALGYKALHPPASYDGAHLLFSGGPSIPSIIAPGALRSVLVAAYPRGAASVLFPDVKSADYLG